MRQTQKLLAARAKAQSIKLLVLASDETLYSKLETEGYQWRDGEWVKRPGIDPTATKGTADIRIRAANGELLDVVKRLQAALTNVGYSIIQVSNPYPDDRHGVAVTSRVYIEVKL